MPRLEEFDSLRQVVEKKSFSRAAEAVGLSQPAVSMQVKSLESEYGVELLHRDGFEIVPTESGYIVYEFACQIVDLYEQSRQRVREISGKVGGRLLIGASTGPGEYLLPLLLGQFKTRHPQVDVALRVGDSSSTIDNVLKHRLELGFVGISRRDRHLHFESFVRDQLIVVVSPEHPWTNQPSISYEQLLQAPLVLQQRGSGATAVLYEALDKYGISLSDLNVIMEVGLQESTKTAVRAGMGVTIISRLGVIEDLARGVLVEVPVEDVELNRDLYVVYRRTLPLSNLARTFLEFAQQAADEAICQIQEGFPRFAPV